MNISLALARLEIPEHEVKPPINAPMSIMSEHLENLKLRVKKQRKLLALKYHPDVCHDETSLDKMKEINEAADFLENLKMSPNINMPMPGAFRQTIIIRMGGMGTSSSQTFSFGPNSNNIIINFGM